MKIFQSDGTEANEDKKLKICGLSKQLHYIGTTVFTGFVIAKQDSHYLMS